VLIAVFIDPRKGGTLIFFFSLDLPFVRRKPLGLKWLRTHVHNAVYNVVRCHLWLVELRFRIDFTLPIWTSFVPGLSEKVPSGFSKSADVTSRSHFRTKEFLNCIQLETSLEELTSCTSASRFAQMLSADQDQRESTNFHLFSFEGGKGIRIINVTQHFSLYL